MKISVAMYKVAFWLLLVAVAILSMISISAQQLFDWQDKLHHMGAYGVLFFLLIQAYGDRFSLGLLAIGLMAFGVSIEVAQSFTEYRQADLWDLAANASGILLAGLTLSCLRRN